MEREQEQTMRESASTIYQQNLARLMMMERLRMANDLPPTHSHPTLHRIPQFQRIETSHHVSVEGNEPTVQELIALNEFIESLEQ